MKRARLSIVVGALSVVLLAAVFSFSDRKDGAPLAPLSAAPLSAAMAQQAPPAGKTGTEAVYQDADFRLGEAPLSAAEIVGREIWYKGTAGNARFHTYVFQQRMGVLIDWYRALRTDQRGQRFRTWGLINDPDCCTPGAPGCPARSLEETYGFDYCPGDQELLKYVGREGYRDPACELKDAPLATDDPHGPSDQRQSTCDLAFGTSTGAMGFRKFPNPRFDAGKWRTLNGGKLGTWEGYHRKLAANSSTTDGRTSHLADGAVEPPFLIGSACGSCHIAFDPLNPPRDPEHPQWQNIKGAPGNQYLRISELMVSGMPTDSPEWQIFAHARPGTSDTSAIPTDQVSNPGTINALINTRQRPTFGNEEVIKWRKVKACEANEVQSDTCWCEPGRQGKCWRKGRATETVHHILKGGEDSIGALEAIQRVYFNIGSCAEACWLNHLTDLRQMDPTQRNFGQTSFDIGQCRRDCPNFRAIEDRLPNIMAFLSSKETDATDLQVARENALKAKNPGATYAHDDLVDELEREFGQGALARGSAVFARTCARCHSSVPEAKGGPFANRDFRATSAATGLREDWMGSDASSPVTEVDTYRCRSLHSNHMAGHVWQEYGSETLRARKQVPGIEEPSDGGRGTYRNISLLSLWAHAPFMHNNAVGPELCGWGGKGAYDFYRSPYVDGSGKPLPAAQQPACWAYDASVEGRFKLYKESVRQLLAPSEREQRSPKVTTLDQDIVIDIGPKLYDGQDEKKLFGFTILLPKGASVAALGNFQHKQLIIDMVLSKLDRKRLDEKRGPAIAAQVAEAAEEIMHDPARMVDVLKRKPDLVKAYSSCTDRVENKGHRFGQDLSDADKKALTAFLATL